MNLKHIMLSLAMATAFVVGAQSHQGYQDGIEYFKADQFDNAKEILTNTLDAADTDRAEALYYLGAIAFNEGDVATARKDFEEGISINPKNGLNYVGLGAIALKSGNKSEAESYFKQAVKAQNKAFIHVAIARAYYNADKVAYAQEYDKYMENAVKKDKKESAIYVMKGDVLRDRALAAEISEGQALIGQAAAEYSQAIYFNPNSPEAYVKYSRVYAKANPQYAIDKLIELNNIAPNSALAQRELAERYYDDGQWTKAAKQYSVYINNPNHFVKDEERYAVLLYSGEDYDKCLTITYSGLEKDPNSVQLKRLLMLCLEAKGDIAGAKVAAEDFFATDGVQFNSNDYSTYARILHEDGDVDGEIAQRKNAAEANPEAIELLKDLSIANTQVGTKYLKADSIENHLELAYAYLVPAAEAWQKYIDLAPADTKDLDYDYMDLGSRYQNVGNALPKDSEERAAAYEKAKAAFHKAIELGGRYTAYRMLARLTMVANNNKASEETADAYTKMVEVLDENPDNREKQKKLYEEAYTYIASYYLGIDDKETAKSYYLMMLELNPDNEALRNYIADKF